jgi:hypothetical protein
MQTVVFLIAWFFIILALGVGGAFEALWNGQPVGPPLALLIPLSLYFADAYWLKSRLFGGFWALDEKWAVATQASRVVGAFFLAESLQDRLPRSFAWPAGSGDVLVGVLAPWVALGLGAKKPYARPLAVVWNVLGIVDFVSAISLGILYAPTPLGVLANGVTTRAVTQYPLCLIPCWYVPASLMLHFRSLQGLLVGLSPARARTVTLLIGLVALLSGVISVGATVAIARKNLPPARSGQSEQRKQYMKTYRFYVERIDYPLPNRTFEEATDAFEREVPAADLAKLAQLVATKAPAAEIDHAVRNMVSELGFTHFAKLNQGPVVSLLGKPKRITVYLLGNPVLANRMFEHRPEIGLYAPLRAAVYEDFSRVTHFTYDRPSTLLQQFENDDVTAVARTLDDRMLKLAERLAGKE